MYNKLKDNNIYCEYYTFLNEGHSFKNSETLEQTLKTELEFYKKVL